MTRDIYMLRQDLQRCIVNNNEHFESNYNLLAFKDSEMSYMQVLGCFENLEIRPSEDNSSLKFIGTVAKDLSFTDEEMKQLRKNVWLKDSLILAEQMKESKKTEAQKDYEEIVKSMKFAQMLDEVENFETEYREAKEDEKNLIKLIQKTLKENTSLDLEYEEHKEMLMLSGNFEYIKLTKNELRLLEILARRVNSFFIVPFYDENDENKCIAVRIVMCLELRKGKY